MPFALRLVCPGIVKKLGQKRGDPNKTDTLIPKLLETGHSGGVNEGCVFQLQIQLNRIVFGVQVTGCAEFFYPWTGEPSLDPKCHGALR
jgi:hypothetical protein